jgi:CDP-glucose 4,6-dehydratase
VVVTTDKCYENREWVWGYREADRLGGADPYAASKSCAELAVASWAASFFPPARHGEHGVAVATARAGNIIGGGDWAADRLVPDFVRAALEGERILLRSPGATRPWQHVLDPVAGYLLLAERLAARGPEFGGPWNFGPDARDARTVEEVVRRLAALWGPDASWGLDASAHPHETHTLRLDSSKARRLLGWEPAWGFDAAAAATVAWTKAWRDGRDPRELCREQIAAHEAAGAAPA